MTQRLSRAFVSRANINRIAVDVLGDILVGRPEQGIYEESAVQNYEIGARLKEEGPWSRTFHYCQASEAMAKTAIGAGPGTGLIEGNTTVAAVAGETQLTIANTVAALNEYAGGFVMPFRAGTTMEIMYRILSNTATAAGVVVLTLKDALLYPCTLPTFTSIWANPYRNILTLWLHQAGLMPVSNVPPIPVTIDYFYWGQTWGVCFGVPSPAFGSGAGERDLVFHSDGSLRLRLADVAGSQQRAGYLLHETTIGNDQGYMLQLDP